jgi:hypothetical protein
MVLNDLPKLKSPGCGVITTTGNVTQPHKKIFWTKEETMAVKQGVKTHGEGKWLEIKTEHADILRNRTSVQIKDRWRIMKRNNEV